MTIIRSIGVTTLVALMSAHRVAAEEYEMADNSFSQTAVDAIEDYLRRWPDRSDPTRSTELPPSYN